MPKRSLRKLMMPFAAIGTAVTFAACGANSAEPKPGERTAALTELPRALTSSEQTVIGAANSYSFSLWRTINAAQHDSNVFVSPLSASFALGMTMNGAAGQTLDEMRSALGFGSTPLSTIDSGYKSLIALLTSLDPSTTMQIANAIFYSNTFPFNQSFLNDTKAYFDAEVSGRNFDDVPGTLAAINGWANDKTNGRIPKVLDSYDPSFVMFLLNAIYFKGTWRDQFDPALTRDASFHAATGGDQPAKLMSRTGKMLYSEQPTYQAVDLAYGDSAFSMTVLLPKAGTDVETLAASLTAESWQALTSHFYSTTVDLSFPKVTFSWKRSLIDDMKALGMHLAFTAADFTPMSPRGKDLFISLLQQNTFVKIDEEGTEAAAVTTVGVSVTSLPAGPVVMRVDRPYLIVIRERLSGTILFMGKITRLPNN